jgi:hypothetical protein
MDIQSGVLCPEVCQSQGFSGCSTASCGEESMSIIYYGTLGTCEMGTLSPEAETEPCGTHAPSEHPPLSSTTEQVFPHHSDLRLTTD